MTSPGIPKESIIRGLNSLSDLCRKRNEGERMVDEGELANLVSRNKEALVSYATATANKELLELSQSIEVPSAGFPGFSNRIVLFVTLVMVGMMGVCFAYFFFLFWIFSPVFLFLFCAWFILRSSANNKRNRAYRLIAEKTERAGVILSLLP